MGRFASRGPCLPPPQPRPSQPDPAQRNPVPGRAATTPTEGVPMPERTPSAPEPTPNGPERLAALIAELFRAAPAPDDLLRELLTLLAGQADLSEQARRAALAALEVLSHVALPLPGLADATGPHTNRHF